MTEEVEVTFVVPTRDRPESLARCLAALACQVDTDFEVIVVDDGSADPASARALVEAHPRARLLRQKAIGPAAARNAGVREARGEFVCFTDDDCEPVPRWSARLRDALMAGADAAGGVTESGRNGDPYANATDVIVRHVQRPDGRVGTPSFAPTNNLASRRALLVHEPFDESFPAASGEDRDWGVRIAESGKVLVIVPDAVVHHFPSTGVRAFWHQHVRYGRGAYRLSHRRSPSGGLSPLSFYVRLVRTGFAHGVRCGLLVVVAQLATAVGFVREARVLRRRQL